MSIAVSVRAEIPYRRCILNSSNPSSDIPQQCFFKENHQALPSPVPICKAPSTHVPQHSCRLHSQRADSTLLIKINNPVAEAWAHVRVARHRDSILQCLRVSILRQLRKSILQQVQAGRRRFIPALQESVHEARMIVHHLLETFVVLQVFKVRVESFFRQRTELFHFVGG